MITAVARQALLCHYKVTESYCQSMAEWETALNEYTRQRRITHQDRQHGRHHIRAYIIFHTISQRLCVRMPTNNEWPTCIQY